MNKQVVLGLLILSGILVSARADFTGGLISRYDFEKGDGSDSWGHNDLDKIGVPTLVTGIDGEYHTFLLVDPAAGQFSKTFAKGSVMQPGTSSNNGSYTIWVRATGPQHRWTNQTHYLYVNAAGDAVHTLPSQIKIYDSTWGSSTPPAADCAQNPQFSAFTYTGTLNHGGDYYSWPDIHQIALIWDGATKTSYIWDSVSGRVAFGDHSDLYCYGDATWILGAKAGDKGVTPWQAYVDEVRYYDHALSDTELSQITPVAKSWNTTENLVARWDFENVSNRGKDSWGNNDLNIVGNPVFVNDIADGNNHTYMLVDETSGKLEKAFGDGSAMDPGAGPNAGSFTVWARVTGPQHRWCDQTHYIWASAAGDGTHAASAVKLFDATWGGGGYASTATDGFINPQWSSLTYYTTIDHGGDYYSWPDTHEIALVWDGTTKTASAWNSVVGRSTFGNNSDFYFYGDVTWTIGVKKSTQGNSPWQAYIDEVRFYNAALASDQLSQITATQRCGTWGYMAGDINKDCQVDFKDVAELAKNWFKCTMPGERGCVDLGYPWVTP